VFPVMLSSHHTDSMGKQYHFWPAGAGDGVDAWDVDRLIELASELNDEIVEIAEIGEVDAVYWFDDERHSPTVRAVVDHARRIAEVEAAYPIILGPDGRVMDGMHRIARAMLDGRSAIRAVRFSKLPEPDHKNCQPTDLPACSDGAGRTGA